MRSFCGLRLIAINGRSRSNRRRNYGRSGYTGRRYWRYRCYWAVRLLAKQIDVGAFTIDRDEALISSRRDNYVIRVFIRSVRFNVDRLHTGATTRWPLDRRQSYVKDLPVTRWSGRTVGLLWSLLLLEIVPILLTRFEFWVVEY